MKTSRLLRASRWRCVALALGLSVATMSSGALAQDKAAAEALFDEGRELLAEEKFEEACKKFEGSQALDPGIGTLLYLGACYEQVGRTASAWAAFREAASLAKEAGQSEREETARTRADSLEAKLFKLSLEVPSDARVDGLKVTRGDTVISESQFGTALPVDPGSLTVRAEAPGYETWSTNVLIPDAPGTQTLKVPALKAGPDDAPAPAPVIAPTPDPTPPPEQGDPGATQRTIGLILGGVGIVGLGVGTIFAVTAIGKDGDADDFCDDDACFDQQGVDLSEDARSAGNIATVGFIAGTVLLAGGAVLFFTAPSADSGTSAAWIGVRPTASPDPRGGMLTGAVLEGAF